MNDLVVKSVDLFGDSVMAAKDREGNIWAGINFFCRGLGMSKRQRDFQVEKVKSDKVLSRGCTLLRAGVFDPANEAYALRLDFIPIWLAKITITDKMQKENPGLAEKLLQYQLKAKDILADAFLPNGGAASMQVCNPSEIPLGELASYLKIMDRVAHRQNLSPHKIAEDFKNDMPILGVEESKITNAVKRKGVECLGGKESNAYNDRSVRGRLYSDLHNQLRRQFGVSTYKAIKRNQADTAVSIIQCYVPPLVLSETIDTLNAQQALEV